MFLGATRDSASGCESLSGLSDDFCEEEDILSELLDTDGRKWRVDCLRR